jgi:hypothetical protein
MQPMLGELDAEVVAHIDRASQDLLAIEKAG